MLVCAVQVDEQTHAEQAAAHAPEVAAVENALAKRTSTIDGLTKRINQVNLLPCSHDGAWLMWLGCCVLGLLVDKGPGAADACLGCPSRFCLTADLWCAVQVYDRAFDAFSKRLGIKSMREWEERREAARERSDAEGLRLRTQVGAQARPHILGGGRC